MMSGTAITPFVLLLPSLLLSGCAGGKTAGEHIADMPSWMGGLPEGTPPRRGTPEYDAWMAKRAEEAARPKAGQPQ
jgi:predicted small secreted protein